MVCAGLGVLAVKAAPASGVPSGHGLHLVPRHGTGLHLLALNCGSSSLKFGLYQMRQGGLDTLFGGEVENIANTNTCFHAQDTAGRTLVHETTPLADPGAAIARIARFLAQQSAPEPQAIGHRIVHGGPRLRTHCVIDDEVLHDLKAAGGFAPLHTPAALAAIGFAEQQFPGRPQVACLDTSFHARMPALASTLPLPRPWREAGIQRYGFHGLSCESIVRQLAAALPARLLIAHLGNGASITAVRQGVSIDTSMGLTPSGGVPMGTRSGDLDPGVMLHLMREMDLDADAIADGVNHGSGLLGVSGISSDMRLLHEAAAEHPEAALAIDMFCYAVAKTLGAMAVALGGADAIVFTGGIGENDDRVRAAICAHLAALGVALDPTRNLRGQGRISRNTSACLVQVLPSQEDEQIARHTATLCGPVM